MASLNKSKIDEVVISDKARKDFVTIQSIMEFMTAFLLIIGEIGFQNGLE